MTPLRVGIVGTGFAGKFHLESLRRVYGLSVDVTAVTSLREESRNAFGKQHSITPYPDVAAMLPHVDVLDICSPPSAHSEAMLLAAGAGKHIICEKPLSGYFGPEVAGEEYHEDADCPRIGDATVEEKTWSEPDWFRRWRANYTACACVKGEG